ncbi:MAG: hypothetical protein JJW00_05090 [Sulfurimonas sp.]|nr:hypothetical protein [Sulfurimonas sp.]
MIFGMNEQDFVAYIIFGITLNFLFSMLFGIYLSKNIGIHEMIKSKGDKEQSLIVSLSIFVPYAKMLITLYRVVILQLYFLNKGYSHKEFWVYMTHCKS